MVSVQESAPFVVGFGSKNGMPDWVSRFSLLGVPFFVSGDNQKSIKLDQKSENNVKIDKSDTKCTPQYLIKTNKSRNFVV